MTRTPDLTYADEPRAARLGASEVAAVLGLSSWRTPFGVWASKRGLESEPETAAQSRGRFLEVGILDWLRAETGATDLIRGGVYTEPWVVAPDGRHPYVGCHPDGLLLVAGVWRGAEAKTARHRQGWGEAEDAVPPAYWIQVQVCLALTGLPAWELAVLFPISEEFRRYPQALDAETAGEMLARAEDWWERHVQADSPPPIDGSDDARRWLLSRHPTQRTPLRAATEAEAEIVRQLARAKRAVKAAEAEEARLAAELQQAIGDGEGITLPEGKATWKAQQSSRVDTTRLKAEAPDLAARYSTTTTTRVLRLALKEE